MEDLGRINNRQIYYIDFQNTDDLEIILPNNNWIVVPICDVKDIVAIDRLVNTCLNKNVNYICALGQQCELLDDWFDEEFLIRRIKNELPIDDPDDFDSAPMTTWHHDFDQGFWFAVTSANPTIKDEYISVNAVVCIDMTIKNKQRLVDLVTKINSGWLPSKRGTEDN